METSPIIIVGSGMAAYTLAREFRKLDADTALTIITADAGDAYSKPMLSTALTQGKTPAQLVNMPADKMQAQLNATILTHTRVMAINITARQVQLTNETLSYSKLVLALGADPVQPKLDGDATGAVHAVNDLADYERFRTALDGKQRVTLFGGGLIGCEFANDLVNAGYSVDLVHPHRYPLERLMPEAAGMAIKDALTQLGVRWHVGFATAVNHADDDLVVTLNDGTHIHTEVALSAIGLRPRTQLAQAAGINTQRGIQVNKQLHTSAPDVYALGDCAEVEGHVLPYVLPLMAQARALAATLAGTVTEVAYPAMPVVIKTPACPSAVAMPNQTDSGRWQVDCSEDGVYALYQDATGKLLGFALTGKASAQRQTLAKQLPPILS
ncbi:MAG: FAD-dependent oxidoreductase [Sulfuriferula sp.]